MKNYIVMSCLLGFRQMEDVKDTCIYMWEQKAPELTGSATVRPSDGDGQFACGNGSC